MNLTDDDRAVLAYYEAHFHDRLTERGVKAANWALLEATGGVAGKDVLDLGCGYPHDVLRWAGAARSWTLVDWCVPALTKALVVASQAGVLVNTALVDARTLPEDWREAFDLVICFATLGEVSVNRERVHLGAYRVLRPGGRYCLTVPDREYFSFEERRGPDVCGYMATWTREGLEVELMTAGFAVREINTTLHAHLSAWVEKPAQTGHTPVRVDEVQERDRSGRFKPRGARR